MIEIGIEDEIDELVEWTNVLMLTEVPFVTAKSINNTLFDIRRRIVGSTFPNAFNVRNRRFPSVLFKVDTIRTSSRNDAGGMSSFKMFKAGMIPEVMGSVNQRLDRGNMPLHVDGGLKRARGSAIAIPVSDELRTKTGRVAKGKKPLNITRRKDVFLKRDSGGRKRFIAKRLPNKRLEIIYVFKKTARIEKRFRFYEDSFDTIEQVFMGHFSYEWARIAVRRGLT